MATLEEALNAAEVAQTNEEWTKLPDYKEKDVYSDMDYTVDLQNKTIQSLEDNVSTFGEQNSQYISFMLDRFYDGVDLKDMRFRVQYELDDGVGSVDNLVNGYYNEEYLKFGWVVPIEATQLSGTIKVMLFCTGTLLEEDYILKTKPIEYTIHNTLPIGGGIPKPDENWFLSFVTDMDEKVATAQGYADSANQASQSAEQSKLSVDESKTHIDTVAAQVESNAEQSAADAQNAATSASAAKESEEKAKQYVDNVLAISPAQVTDAITVDPSFAGGLKVNQFYGKSEQKQYSGKNLLNMKNAKGGTSEGITVTVNKEDGSYTYVGTATDPNINIWLFGKFNVATSVLHLDKGIYYAKGVNLYIVSSIGGWINGRNGGFYTVPDEGIDFCGIRAISAVNGVTYNETVYPYIVKVDNIDTIPDWEPYVGGIPSPNPDYPQEIKSVVEPVVKVTNKDETESQSVTLTGITLNAIPVSSGGNVTIDGQQYISDYVDVERGKIVRMIGKTVLNGSETWATQSDDDDKVLYSSLNTAKQSVYLETVRPNLNPVLSSMLLQSSKKYHSVTLYEASLYNTPGIKDYPGKNWLYINIGKVKSEAVKFLQNNNITVYYPLATTTEESLSEELSEKLLALKTYAGVTNILVSSTELPPMVELEYGAGTAGAYVLQALNLAKINELNIAALTAQTTTTEDEGGEIK